MMEGNNSCIQNVCWTAHFACACTLHGDVFYYRSTADQTSVPSVRLLMPLAMFLLSLNSILEEVNTLQCALIVSQERGVHS